MSFDRTVKFKAGPSPKELRAVCEDYFDGAAELSDKDGTITAILPGRNSFALRRHGLATKAQRAYWREVRRQEPRLRWIEVWPSKDGREIDIATRQHDEFTQAVADGLARVLAHGWGGKVWPPS